MWKFNPKYKYNEQAKFDRIIEFYLWSCPVLDTAYQAKTFEDYGWDHNSKFGRLKRDLLGVNPDKIEFLGISRKQLEIKLEEKRIHHKMPFNEIVLIVGDRPTTKDMFRYIRHSIAHGSFRVKKKAKDEYFYFFESRNPDNNYQISARIILRVSTLLSWIRIIKTGYKKKN